MRDSFRIQIKKSYHFKNGSIHILKIDNSFVSMNSYGMVQYEGNNYKEAIESLGYEYIEKKV